MMTSKEFSKVTEGIPESALAAAKVDTKKIGNYRSPFISACAGKAQLLHFNGALKPWKRKTMGKDHPGKAGALCAAPRQAGADTKLVKCADIWKFYLSRAAEEALQG